MKKFIITIIAIFGSCLLYQSTCAAFTPIYDSSNLIDNPTFSNYSTMSPAQIQTFLSSLNSGLATFYDVERCDSAIAPYYNHCGQSISAAQIISDASNAYGINPRVILATLQKEQSLVTDPRPVSSQLNCAMGYNSCTNYSGFFIQVDNGAFSLAYNYQGALRNNNWLSWHPATYYPCANPDTITKLYNNGLYPGNTVSFSNPGGNPVTLTLANAATASLYCYTPYVGPYSSTGYSGSYNFIYYFQLWFGGTQVSSAYSAIIENITAYSDPAFTQKLTNEYTTYPGGAIYISLKVRNVGNQTWQKNATFVGTSSPIDRSSLFYDSSWISTARLSQLNESSVEPGTGGTFNFTLKAPLSTGSYSEKLNLVQENISWFSSPEFAININVVSPTTPKYSSGIGLSMSQSLIPGEQLISPDGSNILILQPDGNLVVYDNFRAVWSSGTFGKKPINLIMQPDGNLVVYFTDKTTWSSNTFSTSSVALRVNTSGSVTLNDLGGNQLWSTNTNNNPDGLSYVNTKLNAGSTMFPGQQLETANRKLYLLLQPDGNLVLYNQDKKALWNSNSVGLRPSYLTLQPDGNLVIYSNSGGPVWNSGTFGKNSGSLTLQPDGNLVIYSNSGGPVWNSGTFGKF